jgi:hypothetical protein
MPAHDVQCNKCGEILRNHYISPWPSHPAHAECGGELEILWQSTPRVATIHPRERTVIYKHPLSGKVAYPPTNGPMSQHYAEAGYERIELEHVHDVERFEREHGVCNEKLNYNSGNGA